MALGATIYVFKIDLADSDRGVYQPLELRVARHPSETEEHLLTRVLAYCLEYDEGIAFSNGLFDADQPAIAVRDLTGALRVWIDIGAPEAARLHRAAKLAPRHHVSRRIEDGARRGSSAAGNRLRRDDVHGHRGGTRPPPYCEACGSRYPYGKACPYPAFAGWRRFAAAVNAQLVEQGGFVFHTMFEARRWSSQGQA